jgi:hypothetical protein
VDAELETLRTSAARFRDLVLYGADELSFLVASLSTAVELLEGHINAVAANRVCWGTRSALVAALSHLLELEAELEVLGFGRCWRS